VKRQDATGEKITAKLARGFATDEKLGEPKT
jgi:hypothetical protein